MKKDFCEQLYATNKDFKEYVDRCVNDNHEHNKFPDIFENETVYQVGLFYDKRAKEKVDEAVIVEFPKIEEEDKSC